MAGVNANAAAPTADSTVGEVIVTAQKRSERLNDVPLSVTAVTGDQLRRQGVTQVADLEKVVPGFTFQPSPYGTPVFSMRGIGFFDVAVAVAPTVSVYVDQVPLSYSAETEGASLDVARVEALKGPQGTLFGENSTGGAINFIANKPTREFAAGASVTAGNYAAVAANGFVSGPITETLSARLALGADQRGPYQVSETRDAHLGRRDLSTGRFLLDWNPRSDLRFELNVNGWVDRSDTQAAQFVLFSPTAPGGYQDLTAVLSAFRPAPNKPRVADWDPNVSFRRNDNFYQNSLRGDWDLSNGVTLTSITAYSYFRQHSPSDTDGTPYDNFRLTIRAQIQTVSQELRLTGDALDNRLKWMVGGNYEHDISHDNQTGFYIGSNSGVGALRSRDFVNGNNQNITTKAVFGSLDYTLPFDLTAYGSVRYTSVDDAFQGCFRDAGDGELAAAFSQISSSPIGRGQCATLQPLTFAPVPIVAKALNQDNVSWRLGLSWKPQSGTLVYGNVTQGYKAGSFPTVPGLFPNQFDPVPQEAVLAYELGFKKELIQRSLQISGAAFYYDYKDKQILGYITTAFGNLPGLVSIPKSSVRGGELDLTWRPLRALTLTLGGAYVDSRVGRDFLTNDPFNNVIDIKGERFPNTPKFQASGDAQYDFPMAEGLDGYVGISGRYRTDTKATFGNSPYFKIPGYGLLDLRAGVQNANSHWRAEIWGRNLANKFYILNVSHVVDTVARTVGLPATYGVTLSYRY
jgi:iron complex outermembrane receptor protein